MDNQDKNLFKLPDTGYLEKPVVEVQPETPEVQPSAQDIAREEIMVLHRRLLSEHVDKEPSTAESSVFQSQAIRDIQDLRADRLRYERAHEPGGIMTRASVRQLLHSVGVEVEPLVSEETLIEREKVASMSLFKKQQTKVSKASFFLGTDSRFHYAVEAVKAKKNEVPLLMLSYETHAEGTRKTISEYGKINFVEKISTDELRRLNETIAGYYQIVTGEVYQAPAVITPPVLIDENNVHEKIAEQRQTKSNHDLAA